MNRQIEKDSGRLDNLSQINERSSRPRSSTRFVPSKLMEWIVPVLLLILAVALVGTLFLVVLSSVKP